MYTPPTHTINLLAMSDRQKEKYTAPEPYKRHRMQVAVMKEEKDANRWKRYLQLTWSQRVDEDQRINLHL